jgi:hypothetical protein
MRRSTVGTTVYGIDRMLRNVETGRFERSLSALTAVQDLESDGWHGLPANLYITDGSVLPTQGSANPALTIMAVAARAADHLIDDSVAG